MRIAAKKESGSKRGTGTMISRKDNLTTRQAPFVTDFIKLRPEGENTFNQIHNSSSLCVL